MGQRILSAVLTYVPGVAINQHKTGGIVFRFTGTKAQALVTAMENAIDAVIRAANGPEEQEDTEPAIPIPAHTPVGPAQRPRPVPVHVPQPPPNTNGVKIPAGPNLTIEQARAVALELAGKGQGPHNPHRQPTTVRRGSDEARAMAHAQNGGEAPIVQKRRETSTVTGEAVVRGGSGPNRRRTKQPLIVTVQDGRMVTGQQRIQNQINKELAEQAENTQPTQQEPVISGPVPVVSEGFTPNDDDDYGPPPQRIERVGQA